MSSAVQNMAVRQVAAAPPTTATPPPPPPTAARQLLSRMLWQMTMPTSAAAAASAAATSAACRQSNSNSSQHGLQCPRRAPTRTSRKHHAQHAGYAALGRGESCSLVMNRKNSRGSRSSRDSCSNGFLGLYLPTFAAQRASKRPLSLPSSAPKVLCSWTL